MSADGPAVSSHIGGSSGAGKAGVDWSQVGPLSRAARRRYREPMNWSLLAAAGFNIVSVVAMVTFSVRAEPVWREVYYVTTSVSAAYCLHQLWSRREKAGEQFKAFVLQEGFVYSRMLQMYTWTWISINFTVTYLAIVWGSMLFHFSGSAFPGSRNYMWCLSLFVNLPSFLGLDSVSSTITFKTAAVRKGYPGAAYFHIGFYARFFAFAAGVVFFQLAWLLFCFPGGLFFRWEYDMYVLYASVAIYTPLLLFILLPRYANMCKSRDALLSRDSSPPSQPGDAAADGSDQSGPRREQSPSSGQTGRRRRRSITSAFFEGNSAPVPPPGLVTLVQPYVEMSERLLPTSPASRSNPSSNRASRDASAVVPIARNGRLNSSPVRFSASAEVKRNRNPHHCGEAGDVDLAESTTTAERSPSPVAVRRIETAAADETSSGEQSEPQEGMILPGAVTPPVLIQKPFSWELDGDAEGVGTSAASAWQSHRATHPVLPPLECEPSPPPQPLPTEVFVTPKGTGGRGGNTESTRGLDDDSSHGMLGRPVGGRLKRYTTAKLLIGRAKVGVFGEDARRPIHASVGKPPKSRNMLASFGLRSASMVLITEQKMEVMKEAEEGGRPPRRPSASSSAAPLMSRLTGLSNLARGATEFVLFAMRGSFAPLKMLKTGVLGFPAGAHLLLVNVTAAVHFFKDNWRWWAATQTDKFLFTTGFLTVGMVGWPASELNLTTSVPSKVLSAISLAWALALNATVWLGRYSRADEAMILSAVRKGGSIGSGLVFSTASILNALTRGGPVAEGFVATEERLVQTAVVSCRWDAAAAWPLEVAECGGRRRTCTIMLPRIQLLRAALAALEAGCPTMWLDSMSVPQPHVADPPDVATAKKLASRRLIPTMTAVYAAAALVLVVETPCGQSQGKDAYNRRTWTLQECVINRRTHVIYLDGRHEVLGGGPSRRALSGLTDINSGLAEGMDDLAAYEWVLEGGERVAAMRTTREQRRMFPAFADSRAAARSADKAVALGQIFFRVFFEHVDVATGFMLEVSALLAAESGNTEVDEDDTPVMLIDNEGWDGSVMTGSACRSRYLMGKPSVMEAGPRAMWHLRRVFVQQGPPDVGRTDSAKNREDGIMPAPAAQSEDWWLCEVALQGRRVPVAVLPGELIVDGGDSQYSGHLRALRTCSSGERAAIKGALEGEELQVLWM